MDKDKINASIDKLAEEAERTVDLMATKIDEATRCGRRRMARNRREMGDRFADKVSEAGEQVGEKADRLADEIRRRTR